MAVLHRHHVLEAATDLFLVPSKPLNGDFELPHVTRSTKHAELAMAWLQCYDCQLYVMTAMLFAHRFIIAVFDCFLFCHLLTGIT